jgi:excinuclease UvrABC nuclease subunit
MNRQARRLASTVSAKQLPKDPGVYAWYRNGQRIYVGKATSLQTRVGRNHLGKGRSLGTSAFRRNVAEHLGLGFAAEIKDGRRVFDVQEILLINTWIGACEVAWIVCGSEADACKLEDSLKEEFLPPLTKQ